MRAAGARRELSALPENLQLLPTQLAWACCQLALLSGAWVAWAARPWLPAVRRPPSTPGSGQRPLSAGRVPLGCAQQDCCPAQPCPGLHVQVSCPFYACLQGHRGCVRWRQRGVHRPVRPERVLEPACGGRRERALAVCASATWWVERRHLGIPTMTCIRRILVTSVRHIVALVKE